MKVLLVIDEMWNDQMHGNNVLSNWFTDIQDVEFAAICCNPGLPQNKCCYKYFQVTDSMMVKSILGKRAGRRFEVTKEQMYSDSVAIDAEKVPVKFYSFMKSITNNFIYVVRDFIWMLGRYNKKELETFVREFNPDIVYCPRMFTVKMYRLEKIVRKFTHAPFVAFVADDEVSLNQKNSSLIYWMRRYFHLWLFKKHVGIYKHYYTFSKDQSENYTATYGVPSSTLYKCGKFNDEIIKVEPNKPIRIVYAGSLYCNRWKTLHKVGQALKEINKDGKKVVLDIYTRTILSKEQKEALSEDYSINMKGGVSPDALPDIYKAADIALHVESFDEKYKLITRWSFSTKIIDLMASSCAVMAICWDQHTGYKYLKDNDAAICVDDYSKLYDTLKHIVDHPEVIKEYAHKAFVCGQNNHNKEKIQKQIISEFSEIIKSSHI